MRHVWMPPVMRVFSADKLGIASTRATALIGQNWRHVGRRISGSS